MDDVPIWLALLLTAATGVGGIFGGSFWMRSRTDAEADTLRLKQQSENWEKIFDQQRLINEQREETIKNMAGEIREYKELTRRQSTQIADLERRLVEMETKFAQLTAQ